MTDGTGSKALLIASLLPLAFFLFRILYSKHQQTRSEELQSLAESMSLNFSVQGRPETFESLKDFHVFSHYGESYLENEIWGERNGSKISTYKYIIHCQRSETSASEHKNIVTIDIGNRAIPSFQLRPESLSDKVWQALGDKDINFQDFPEFSKKFLLRSNDTQNTRKSFSDNVIKYLEQHEGTVLEVKNNTLLFYKETNLSTSLGAAFGLLTPEEIKSLISEGEHIVKLLAMHSVSQVEPTEQYAEGNSA